MNREEKPFYKTVSIIFLLIPNSVSLGAAAGAAATQQTANTEEEKNYNIK